MLVKANLDRSGDAKYLTLTLTLNSNGSRHENKHGRARKTARKPRRCGLCVS